MLVVAGVDLSHIGPKFGHNAAAGTMLPAAQQHDRRLLDAFCRGDICSLWEEIQSCDDQFNICGFSTLACLLELFPEVQGQVLDYEFWQEEATQSAVSYAAVIQKSRGSG
jgi:hypothetical protein